jgi:hypothetical protein
MIILKELQTNRPLIYQKQKKTINFFKKMRV